MDAFNTVCWAPVTITGANTKLLKKSDTVPTVSTRRHHIILLLHHSHPQLLWMGYDCQNCVNLHQMLIPVVMSCAMPSTETEALKIGFPWRSRTKPFTPRWTCTHHQRGILKARFKEGGNGAFLENTQWHNDILDALRDHEYSRTLEIKCTNCLPQKNKKNNYNQSACNGGSSVVLSNHNKSSGLTFRDSGLCLIAYLRVNMRFFLLWRLLGHNSSHTFEFTPCIHHQHW